MTAFPKSFKSFFGIIFSVMLFILSCFQGIMTKGTDNMPATPDSFVPAIRFLACSDVHEANDRFADMMSTAYGLYDNDPVYPGIDAVTVAGDFTNSGTEEQIIAFKNTVDASVREGTESFVILGNHELHTESSRECFKRVFGVDPERHITINGFHFIGVSNFSNGYPASTVAWASEEVNSAIESAPELPVFTFQHPHNTATVYGSVNWGSPALTPAWENNSNVINFSGHSHYPMNDPRSIWQGSYTALGCGTLKYFEMELDLKAGQFPTDNDQAAQFYIVEADRDGSVRIRCYDLISHTFFGEEYYIDKVSDTSTFAYTYKNRMSYDNAPVFADGAEAQVVKNEKGEYILTFDKAQDKLIVHDYKIKVTSSLGIVKYSESIMSDYYLVNDRTVQTYNLGALDLKAGETYKVEIIAVNAYYELSEGLFCTFKA